MTVGPTLEKVKAIKKSIQDSEATLVVVATMFHEMAKDSFSFEDAKWLCNHTLADADFSLRQAINEALYICLNWLAAKYARIKHLEHSVDKLMVSKSSHH